MNNPFAAQTIRINESRPREAHVPAGVRAISIVRELADLHVKPRPDELDEVMAALPGADIDLLEIDYNSRLRRLPRLESLPNLRYLHIGARSLMDLRPLFAYRNVESLFLVACREESLAGMATRQVTSVRLIRGRVKRLDLSARDALLQGCTDLEELGDVELEGLVLETCKRFDLFSLARVRGLRRLDLLGPGPLTSVEFARKCRSLEKLTITATPLGKTDFAALGEAPSLRRVFLPVGDARLGELSALFRHLMFDNGRLSLLEGQPIPRERFYRTGQA